MVFCATFLLLEIGVKTLCATVVLLKKWRLLLKSLKLVQNTVHNCPVARNWRQNTLRNCRFASNWRLLLKSLKLLKTARATVNLLKWACLVRNVQTSSNSPLLFKFSSIFVVRSETCRHFQSYHICAKECAHQRIVRN